MFTIILSGGKVDEEQGQIFSEAEHMKSYFDEWYAGDGNHTLILEDESTNSIANIDNALKLIPDEQDIIYIVSSDYHIPRLLQTYQNRIKKGKFKIGDISTVLAMEILQDSPDTVFHQSFYTKLSFNTQGLTICTEFNYATSMNNICCFSNHTK